MIRTIGVWNRFYGEGPGYGRFGLDDLNEKPDWYQGTNLAEVPISAEEDGGIGDGAGGLDVLPDGPIPVDADGGIGDGAVALDDIADILPTLFLGEGAVGIAVSETPISIDSDGGIGDGAVGLDVLIGGPLPVDADGGIGDGAGPLDGADDADGIMTILPYPMPGDGPFPIEGDGGIGDGAMGLDELHGGPLPVDAGGGIGDGAGPLDPGLEIDPVIGNEVLGGGAGTDATDTFFASDDADTFFFGGSHGEDIVYGFEVGEDTLDLSQALLDFEDLSSLRANAYDIVNQDSGDVYGVYIITGEGSGVYLDGISSADFAAMDVVF